MGHMDKTALAAAHSFNPRATGTRPCGDAQQARNPFEAIAKHYTLTEALTEKQKADFFRLRYQVYCIERKFENPANFPDSMERDPFDQTGRCAYFLIRDRKTGTPLGGFRFVFPQAGQAAPTPVQSVCTDDFLAPERIGGSYAEMSRFCLSKDTLRKCMLDESIQKLAMPALLTGMFAMGQKYGVRTLIGAMEPKLFRHLGRIGINMPHQGKKTDFHGVRQAFSTTMKDMLAGIQEKVPALHAFIDTHMSSQNPAANDISPIPNTANTPQIIYFADRRRSTGNQAFWPKNKDRRLAILWGQNNEPKLKTPPPRNVRPPIPPYLWRPAASF
ncbi:MAG: PEP-CTERM/exosortase system-associated acyltransferase [Alphaproteobacteria bacterium]|nr:PEP-CTERM/exosortase system-associated acyltransferase [Alphaproteobacteria bacterium]